MEVAEAVFGAQENIYSNSEYSMLLNLRVKITTMISTNIFMYYIHIIHYIYTIYTSYIYYIGAIYITYAAWHNAKTAA